MPSDWAWYWAELSELTGKSVEGSSQIIGLGIGILAAAVYTMMRKK